jgi:two-component system response regulator TctD
LPQKGGGQVRILLAEDTGDVAEAIVDSLARAGFACDVGADLAAAEAFLRVQAYDAIILDINLPDGDGRDLLRAMRRAGDRTPVLMLTARFEVSARIGALNEGADDSRVNPCDLRDLEARGRALTRRAAGRVATEMRIADLVFDPSARTVQVAGAFIAMTRREMALLDLLVSHRGRIMSKERLFDGLFSFDDSDVGMNTIELYVGRLRKKLAGSGVRIETHRGLGYRLGAVDDA